MENGLVKTPLRFVPFLRPMVWGGRRLSAYLEKPLPLAEPYGEAWLVSDHPVHRSVVATGSLAGMSLRELMDRDPLGLLGGGDRQPVFPWLIKFLDASDWLSVQVHPDAAAVRELWPGEGSKTEAWFVLDAAPGSRVYAGLLPGVGRDELRARLQDGRVTECLHSFEPRRGDCVFLPAGTVHAVGGGVLMAEVQQTSDATFRLFDWDRRDAQGKARKLHIDESLASIHWYRGPVEPVRAGGQGRQQLVECPYFLLEHIGGSEPFVLGGDGRLRAVVVLSGAGRLESVAGAEPVRQGQAWVLPAALPAVRVSPTTQLAVLVATRP